MPKPTPKVRVLTSAEIEEAYRIWSLAFERGSRQMDHWRRGTEGLPEGSIEVGIYEGEKLQAVLGIINFRCYFGPNAIVPMGGIGGVASLPASRGRGYAGACLDFALRRMHEAGQVISMLGPFSWAFYQRYGWDWIGLARHYTLPASVIKSCLETEKVREAQERDHAAIRDAYARHARRYRGALIRSEHQWKDILADTDGQYTSIYVYEDANGVEGYLSYRGGSRDNLGLREFVALSPTSQRALLGLLRRLDMQFRKVSWKAPEDDPLWHHFYDWEIETKMQPVFMGRIVDLPAALQAWTPDNSANTVVQIEVRDANAPWNEGAWQVTCEGNNISAQKTTKAPQVSLDIQALSQAYFGRPNLAELRAAGRILVHDEAAFQSLCSLLDGPPTWMNDFF